MTGAEVIALIMGVLKFPGECLALIRLLQGTPEEHRQKIRDKINEERETLEKTGRPSW